MSDPSTPLILSSLSLADTGFAVALFEHGAAVAASRAGMITCQMMPDGGWTQRGRLDEAGWVYTALGANGYAYVDRQQGLAVVDIQDPARPHVVRTLPQLSGRPAAIVNGRLYTAGSRLWIYDLTDPVAPALRGNIGISMFIGWVDVREPFAFVVCKRDALGDGAIIDVSNPASPQLVSTIQTQGEVEAAGVNGNAWYLSTESGVEVFDVTDPAAPRSLGVFPDLGFDAVAFTGNIAFMSGERMKTVDVSDPANPRVLLTWPVDGNRLRRIKLAGAYLIGGPSINFGGTMLFQVADPLNPRTLARIYDVEGVWSVVDTQAILSDGRRGMTIVRFGDQADLNLDARVDLGDLSTLLAHFGTTGSARRPDGDLDGDADVDLDDLLELLAHYGVDCE